MESCRRRRIHIVVDLFDDEDSSITHIKQDIKSELSCCYHIFDTNHIKIWEENDDKKTV